ncbi:hypothetical protein VTI28DRAFT_7726 [Corynascus sepedonium]
MAIGAPNMGLVPFGEHPTFATFNGRAAMRLQLERLDCGPMRHLASSSNGENMEARSTRCDDGFITALRVDRLKKPELGPRERHVCFCVLEPTQS